MTMLRAMAMRKNLMIVIMKMITTAIERRQLVSNASFNLKLISLRSEIVN